MLVKTTSLNETWGVVGQVCVQYAAPPAPSTPPSPAVPPPPIPGVPPPAPPLQIHGGINIFTYQDHNDNCWRVTEWLGIGGIQERYQKTPINCAEL